MTQQYGHDAIRPPPLPRPTPVDASEHPLVDQWVAALSAGKSLAKCAPAKTTDPGIRAVWEPVIGDILATVPK